MIVNINLKKARKNSDLTQSEVAKKVGISVTAYQNYEAERRIPNARTAVLIARAVGSTVEKLFAAALDKSTD